MLEELDQLVIVTQPAIGGYLYSVTPVGAFTEISREAFRDLAEDMTGRYWCAEPKRLGLRSGGHHKAASSAGKAN
ncbi:hypothetical protein HALA3H3_370037 [Halomonas sp. A3H3]|nr:hypothetical protein HALA3H3_370037 [Halomonas sp. A3H3]